MALVTRNSFTFGAKARVPESQLDLFGDHRGPHQHGDNVCAQFQRRVPHAAWNPYSGQSPPPGEVHPNNDITLFNCACCGDTCHAHVLLATATELNPPPPAPVAPVRKPAHASPYLAGLDVASAPSAEPELVRGSALDMDTDPLAINSDARRR